ncbi:MAG: HEAT repeat domain-containing protein [Bacteroidetes bacterium]|nr:HEAT repeat domain-containing protein [Bacteroidota bacterium]
MKRQTAAVLLTLTLAISAYATTPASNATIDWSKAEKNYTVALASENIGLRHSAASYIAEYRLAGAVVSLIGVLQNDKVEQMRMAAAQALVQLGNKDGLDAVKDAAQYDGSEKVARYCEQLISSLEGSISQK